MRLPSTSGPALATDLYQLTMLQAYLEHDMTEPAVFELFVRRLPRERGFLVAAGLEQALDYLEELRFADWELDWVAKDGRFGKDFVDALAALRFTGEVVALPEGTIFFENEPILRVRAPLPEAQLVETRLINLVHFQTLIASKAARLAIAAPGKLLVDFGLRRAHGAEAGLLAARAGYLAGLSGSSNVEAAARFGVPAYGTMAHSFVEAHETEEEAFVNFARSLPANVVLLIDTYDTARAAEKVVEVARRLHAAGVHIHGVRLNSGDPVRHAREVRRILDAGGLRDTTIFASGNLDEHSIRKALAAGAPIDGFGVGSRLVTSADAPYLDCAYKLVEYADRPRAKRSEGKETGPGAKQVVRHLAPDGRMIYDVLGLADELHHDGEPLLMPVMRSGRRLLPSPPLAELRSRAAAGLASLPDRLRGLSPATQYPVHASRALYELARQLAETEAWTGVEEHPTH